MQPSVGELRDWPIDRVLERDVGRKCVATKLLSFSDPIFSEHFPEMPVYPGSLVLNSAFATGRAMMEDSRRWRVAGVKRVSFRRPCLPGRGLRITATAGAEGRPLEVRFTVVEEGGDVVLSNGLFTLEPVEP